MRSPELKYLALGDSYTIGYDVVKGDRWPTQLVVRLRKQGIPIVGPIFVAQSGWTTEELLAGIHRAHIITEFDLVSLQIGVNNQYRGQSEHKYRDEFRRIIKQAVQFAGGDPNKLIVLSIPDWSVTPFAFGRDRDQIAAQIDLFNLVNRIETASAGAAYIDITPTSRLACRDTDLVTTDGLHPSGKMYQHWVELVLPVAVKALQRVSP